MSKLYKEFFRGFSKVFKGPSDKAGFSGGKRFATIGGVKPKVKPSEASVKFEEVKKQIDQGLDKGIRDFKTENPNRLISDDQMKQMKMTGDHSYDPTSGKKFIIPV